MRYIIVTVIILLGAIVYEEMFTKPKIIIIGSYKKCYSEMLEARNQFEKNGFEVLFPIKSQKVGNPKADFVLLKGDEGKTPEELQRGVNEGIRSLNNTTDFVYILNLSECEGVKFGENWTGHSTDFEYGYAIALGKRVVCANKPNTLNHTFFCDYPGKSAK